MMKKLSPGFSFQTRITAAAMATAVSVLLVACALFTAAQWEAERATLTQYQKHAASILAPRLAEAIKNGEVSRAPRIMRAFELSSKVTGAAFLDPKGVQIANYVPVGVQPKFARVMQSRSPVTVDGRDLGVLVIRSGLEPVASFLPRYLALSGGLFFAATALSLFLGRLLAKRVIEPVGRLSRAMGEVAISGDLGQRVEATEDDEFGRLIDSFNALLDRLNANDLELRETVQALVVARDDAQAANVHKSQFLANMSHEIRTPLNGVLAMAQVMAIGDLTRQQRERLQVIHTSGEALLAILNDILDVSKIEAGKLELETVEFDLDPLVRAATDGFAAVTESKGLDLTIELEPAAQGLRLGDPARLRQILSNLVSNAVKFTAKGSVQVKVQGLGQDGFDGLRFVVTDTGIGIAKEKLPLLFQKFTQLDASTTRQFGGTGLGLSICRDLTEKMGGTIWAEGAEGGGTTFFVELPLPKIAPAVIDEAEDDVASDDEDRPMRILAAEDNPTNQVVLSTILEIFGVELEMVENGKAAVDAWAVGDYDLILMDIQMPVMDGIAAAIEIRRVEAAENRVRTPIVSLSANAMSHQVEQYMAAGMDGHVAKPIELAKLQAALEDALTMRREQQALAA